MTVLESPPGRGPYAPRTSTLRPPERRPDYASLRLVRAFIGLWPLWLGVFYAATGSFFIAHHVLIGDAISRTSTARMVVSSSDAHLAAIGWVWGPVPTFLEIPLTLLYSWIPWFVKDGYCGLVITVLFGVWGTWQINRMLLENGASAAWRLVITGGIALNPLIIIFAGNGMSEAIYLGMLCASMRHLLRWARARAVGDLALAGLWVGIDVLVRFESLGAAAGVAAFVAVASWMHYAGEPQSARLRRTAVDVLIVVLPVVFCFACFVGFSWWFTGVPLAQYSSVYGQSDQIVGFGDSVFAFQRVPAVAHQLIGCAPLLPVILPLGALLALRRRSALGPAVLCTLGPALMFDLINLSDAGLFDLMRYVFLSIPLTILLLSELRAFGRIGLLVALAGVIATGVSCWILIGERHQAGQEFAYRQAVLGRPAERYSDLQLGGARRITDWLDAHKIARSSILIDTDSGFEVLAETKYPGRFVIPSARGYQSVLNDPWRHGIRYMVMIPPAGAGVLYTLDRYYPGMYEGCVAGTQRVYQTPGTGTPSEWRIYKLTRPISPNNLHYTRTCPVHRLVLGG